jgi:L-lactate dehydrogenase complex protein LldE
MIKLHYPALFVDDPVMQEGARQVATRTCELTSFLAQAPGARIEARYDGVATYHDSCSGLRELGVKDAPRRLLSEVAGLRLKEMATPEVCCGFGGTFCVKYPAISDRMASDKAADIEATGADTLLAGDMGCLLNMAGKLTRRGARVRVRHVAEVLAGMTDEPPLGSR